MGLKFLTWILTIPVFGVKKRGCFWTKHPGPKGKAMDFNKPWPSRTPTSNGCCPNPRCDGFEPPKYKPVMYSDVTIPFTDLGLLLVWQKKSGYNKPNRLFESVFSGFLGYLMQKGAWSGRALAHRPTVGRTGRVSDQTCTFWETLYKNHKKKMSGTPARKWKQIIMLVQLIFVQLIVCFF